MGTIPEIQLEDLKSFPTDGELFEFFVEALLSERASSSTPVRQEDRMQAETSSQSSVSGTFSILSVKNGFSFSASTMHTVARRFQAWGISEPH